MDTIKSTAEDLFDHAGDLVETYYKLTVVKAADKASGIASSGLLALTACALGLIILFFAGIGLAWWIGESMNDMKMGFFIVGAAFLVLLLILILTRKQVFFPKLRNLLIRKMYE
jgi:uncharacterized membrane protein